MSDRTGELCSFCKKGRLYPTGKRESIEPAKIPKSGETHRESTEYECDNCHRKPKAHGISLIETIEGAKPKVKVYRKKRREQR